MYSPLSFFRAVRRLRMLQRGRCEIVRRVSIRASERTHLITASRMGSSVCRSVEDQQSIRGDPPWGAPLTFLGDWRGHARLHARRASSLWVGVLDRGRGRRWGRCGWMWRTETGRVSSQLGAARGLGRSRGHVGPAA